MSCAYCEEDTTKEQKMISVDGWLYSFLDNGWMHECMDDGAEVVTEINYCPMCGRRLKK